MDIQQLVDELETVISKSFRIPFTSNILVNEDDHHRLGVDVRGLSAINGRQLHLLYGDESVLVSRGNLVTRMQPYEVKVFSTAKSRFETDWKVGRDF